MFAGGELSGTLTQLPREMVAAIAAHLSPRDITACSGVSVSWRAAFNLNRIWKPFCSFGPEYFQEELNRVKPGFEIPHVNGVQLEPLCEWRITFLKEIYVARNWQKGHFSSDEVEIRTNTCLYAMDAVDSFQNHWMFLCCSTKEGLKLEVWNIKGVPFLQMSTNMRNIFKNIDEAVENNNVNFKLHLTGEKLLFIYDNLVTVFKFTQPHFRLDFLYNFSFVHTAPFFSPRRITHLPEGSLCEVEVVGDYLYGVSYSARDRIQQFSPSVHVWNLDAAVKVKDHCVFEPKGEQSFPYFNSLFLTSGNSQNLVITRTFEGDIIMSTRIRIFNMKKNEYGNFFVQLKFPVLWTAVARDIVVVCELVNALEKECVFYFYNTALSTCLMKTDPYNIYHPDKISSSKSRFAFIDLNYRIIQYDILTQESFTSSLHPSRNRLKNVILVNDQLLLLESKYRGTCRSFQNILVSSYEIWDLAKRTKPLRLDQCFRSMCKTKCTFVRNVEIPPKLLTIAHPLYRSITVCVNSFW